MKLPNRDAVYIPVAKLTEYLLSETHSEGKAKAKFFRACGYSRNNPEVLEQHLKQLALEKDIVETVSSPYGTKYVIDGTLSTPAKGFVGIRTIWIIENSSHVPRFVTAYPREAEESG